MAITFILIGASVGIVLLDQIVKWLCVWFMPINTVGIDVDVIPGFFGLEYMTNSGMSFGLFDEGAERWIFMIISPIALVAIGIYLFKFAKNEKLPMKLGLAFILGGGFSNMIDRIFYGESLLNGTANFFDSTFWSEVFNGKVVDMIYFYFNTDIWNAVFNVADSFVCIGAGFVICSLIYDLIFNKSEKRKEAEQKALELNKKMNGDTSGGGVLLPENDDNIPFERVEIDEKSDSDQENEVTGEK